MSKKIAVVGGAGQIAAAAAHALLRSPGSVVNVDMTYIDGAVITVDETGQNIGYDSKMIDSLKSSLSERELYGIELHEAHRLIFEGRVGEYKLSSDVDNDTKFVPHDGLPKNAKKPKFLLEQNHRITKVRR